MRYVLGDRVAVYYSYNDTWEHGIVAFIRPPDFDTPIYYKVVLDIKLNGKNKIIIVAYWRLTSIPTIEKLQSI